ncbi:MAG: M67 family metallopeptidase [Nitrospinota bacterium]|nr:M67 family metallopeptidase [Nitrospinota bacterium]
MDQSPMKRQLRGEDLAVMRRHAEEEFPSECCGLVLGMPGDPSRNEVRPCGNIQDEMRRRDPAAFQRGADTGYFMDPNDLRDAFRDAARNGLEVVGFYHSHPDHGAYWSEEDHRAAMWGEEPSYPDAFHVVISVMGGKAAGESLFTWDSANKRFTASSQG